MKWRIRVLYPNSSTGVRVDGDNLYVAFLEAANYLSAPIQMLHKDGFYVDDTGAIVLIAPGLRRKKKR